MIVFSFLSSAGAAAALQQRLGEVQTELCGKEEECSKAAQERDRLAKELKDQAELHKTALKQAEDNEARLLAEFETERTSWAETEAALTAGYGKIEDIVDGEPSSLFLSCRLLNEPASSFWFLT